MSHDATSIYSDQPTNTLLSENEKKKNEKCFGHNTDEKVEEKVYEDEYEDGINGKEEKRKGRQEEEEEDVDDEASWEESGIPYDRGWAWMITLGSFVLFLILLGNNILLSVLLMDIIDYFHTTMTIITILFSLYFMSYSVACQITVNMLVNRISARKMFMSATFMNAVCTLLLVFVPNMPLFMAVNCLKAFSHGIVLMPSLALVGQYFKRRRALASSLALLGLSGASLLCPLLVRYLKEEYGLRGCFLLIAGYEMHGFVAACLLRPISSYSSSLDDKKNNIPAKTVPQREVKIQTTKQTENSSQVYPVNVYHRSRSSRSWDLEEGGPASGEEEAIAKQRCLATDDSVIRCQDVRDRRQDDASQLETLLSSNEGKNSGENKPGISSLRNTKLNPPQSPYGVNPTNDLRRATTNPNTLQPHGHQVKRTKIDMQSTSSLEFLSRVDLSSSLTSSSFNLAEIEHIAARQKRTADVEHPGRGKTSAWTTCLTVIRAIFNFSVLQSWSGAVYVICYVLGRSVGLVAVYLPAYATLQGLGKTQAALLLTIYGGMDMVSRVFFGYLGDLHLARPKYIIAATCLIMSVLGCFARFYTTFPYLVFCSAAMGFFGCVSLSLNTNNIIDMHGLDKLGSLLAVSSLCLGLGSMIQYPIVGVLIEATATFESVFYYVAVSYFVSAATSVLHEIMMRVVSLKKAMRQDDVPPA